MKKLLLFASFIFLFQFSFGQEEGNNWYFGENAGLNFDTFPPTPITGSLNSLEGCSTISDAQGNLLFYTDGSTVWNSAHSIMDNGTGLSGSPTAAQSSLIVPVLTNSNWFYIFTVGINSSLSYSLVDISMNNGNGGFVRKNFDVSGSNNLSTTHEKIAATEHIDGDKFWVCTFGNNQYYSYIAFNGGILNRNNEVISTITSNLDDNRGILKFSPDGTKIINTSVGDGAVIADFDKATGIVSNPIILTNPHSSGSSFYGAEFSPDSNLLYIDFNSSSAGNTCSVTGTRQILQYQIDGPQGWNDSPNLLMSAPSESRGDMKLAPDGNIYVARSCQQWLGIITDPNNLNIVSYNPNGLQLANGSLSREGLPNTVQILRPTAGLQVVMDNLINISPNPTSGIIQLNAKNAIQSLTIHDLNGRLLNKTSFVPGALNETIDLEGLNSGIYLMTVVTSEGHATERVVVK